MFLSRSTGKSEEDQAYLKELKVIGYSSQCFPCDVTDHDTIESTVNQASLPITGVMQIAMVLRDVGVMGMDLDS